MLTEKRKSETTAWTNTAFAVASGLIGAAAAAAVTGSFFLSQGDRVKNAQNNMLAVAYGIAVLAVGSIGGVASGEKLRQYVNDQNKARFARYKQSPLQDGTIADTFNDLIPLARFDKHYQKDQETYKTWRVLLVPEGYDAETLQRPDFRRGVERYQAFLQAHFPKHLVSVGIAWPDRAFDTTRSSEAYGRTAAKDHPLLGRADAIVTLWNTEDRRLLENSLPEHRTAITRGPTPRGEADLEMLMALLHETLHLIPGKQNTFSIKDSYENEFLKNISVVNNFEHSGFLPDIPIENWPKTHVTDAVRYYQVPLVPYSQNGRNYLAIEKRTHIMDIHNLLAEPIQQIAFGLTGGKMIPDYLKYIINQNLTDWLEEKGRITPAEATTFREQHDLGAQQKMNPSPLFYLSKIFGRD